MRRECTLVEFLYLMGNLAGDGSPLRLPIATGSRFTAATTYEILHVLRNGHPHKQTVAETRARHRSEGTEEHARNL